MGRFKQHSHSAYTLVEVLVIVCVIALLAALAIPNFIRPRSNYSTPACINNLRIVDAAANQFALEYNKTNGERTNFPNDLTPYIKLTPAGKIPGCPQGGVYHLTRVGDTVTCSLGTTITPAHILNN